VQQFFFGPDNDPPTHRGLVRSRDFGDGGQPATSSDAKPPPVHNAGPDSLATARWIIGLGDIQFANQKYRDAFLQYAKASKSAPGLAEADFRQGIALIALGRYEPAAKAIKRGLDRNPKWPASGFTLGDLYGSNHADKRAHMEKLAKATETPRDNADLLFLAGVCLHFDGSPDRAAAFFNRAARFAGNAPYLKAFQDSPTPAPKLAHEEVTD
jgi:tetratricopeptide (TPR) repeat protein